MLRWISFYTLDAVGRIGLKIVATILFARWLSPEVFGRASLTIVIVSVLAIFVSAPFEEALTQRKVVRRAHFATSLSACLVIALVLLLAAFTAAFLLAAQGGEVAGLAQLVAVFCVFLFAHGPVAIYTAIARRHRAFTRIAWSNLAGDVVGTLVGLALALMGVGVWSLLSVRLVGRFVTLAWLVVAGSVRILPRFTPACLRDLSAFAGWILASRCLIALSDAVFQGLVARLFGLSGAGYLNMALRVIEPVRGVTNSMGHNIATSFFVRAQDAPERLRQIVRRTVTDTSLILLPIYIGLAAVGPTVIALMGGPAWADAAPLVIWLALASALTAPTNFVMSALAATGRGRLCFMATLTEFVLMVGSVYLLMPLGLVLVGAARLISNVGEAGFGVVAARTVLAMPIRDVLGPVAPILSSAALMGLATAALGATVFASDHRLLALFLQIGLGVAVYALLALLFHRDTLAAAYRNLKGNPAAAAG